MKLFSLNLSENELMDIKQLLSNYFADKASDEMDRLWEENDWNDDTMDKWLEGNS